VRDQGSGPTLAKRQSCWLGAGVLFLLSALLILWWRAPGLPPTFPTAVEHLDRQIWLAGGANLFPKQYAAFHQEVTDFRQHWRVEVTRWWATWTLEEFTDTNQQLMQLGATLLTDTEKKALFQQNGLKDSLKAEQAQLVRLRRLNGLFDFRGKRTPLSHAESYLAQGLSHLAQGQLDAVPHLLMQAQVVIRPIEEILIRQMIRYSNEKKIAQWARWVKDTIEHSRQTGGSAMVVIKASRKLQFYQGGLLRHEYPTDLGFSGLQDKLYEGDGATPEGLFHIVQKKHKGETKFHKAFLLDFPTPAHQHRFSHARAQGLIPGNRGIGGLIEIHGQRPGQRELTNGCVALNNATMDTLFPLIPLNTPVVIVGTLDPINPVSKTLEPIQQHHTQRESVVQPSPIGLSRQVIE